MRERGVAQEGEKGMVLKEEDVGEVVRERVEEEMCGREKRGGKEGG